VTETDGKCNYGHEDPFLSIVVGNRVSTDVLSKQ
jgi:hypothetical protein